MSLVMSDSAKADSRSVSAGLRGIDDGRVGWYEQFVAENRLNIGEQPLGDVLSAYGANVRAGMVPVLAKPATEARVRPHFELSTDVAGFAKGFVLTCAACAIAGVWLAC
jgi:hypothetical protein